MRRLIIRHGFWMPAATLRFRNVAHEIAVGEFVRVRLKLSPGPVQRLLAAALVS